MAFPLPFLSPSETLIRSYLSPYFLGQVRRRLVSSLFLVVISIQREVRTILFPPNFL